MGRKFWPCLGLAVLLAACSTTTVVPIDTPVAVPDIEPLTLNPVQWQVMTVPQLKQLAAKLEASTPNQSIVFVLDKKNYDNLSLNLIDITRYINEQKAILIMLKTIIAKRTTAAPR